MPGYDTTTSFGNKWHGDVIVNCHLFRTVRQCDSPDEAQNTAAHAALYQIFVNESSSSLDAGTILPADPPAFPDKASSGDVVLKREDSPADMITSAAPAQEAAPPTQSSVPAANPAKVTKTSRRRKKGVLTPQQLPGGPKGANLEPLGNSRWAPIEVVPQETPQDPLGQLKAVQAGLKELHRTASFYKLMKSKSLDLRKWWPLLLFPLRLL